MLPPSSNVQFKSQTRTEPIFPSIRQNQRSNTCPRKNSRQIEENRIFKKNITSLRSKHYYRKTQRQQHMKQVCIYTYYTHSSVIESSILLCCEILYRHSVHSAHCQRKIVSCKRKPIVLICILLKSLNAQNMSELNDVNLLATTLRVEWLFFFLQGDILKTKLRYHLRTFWNYVARCTGFFETGCRRHCVQVRKN